MGSYGPTSCPAPPPPPTPLKNQPRRGRNCCARTTELMAESVYGRDIQSIVTDR